MVFRLFSIIIYSIGLAFFPINLKGNIATDADNIIIHLNQSFYVTGDIVWYKVYLPNSYKSQSFPIKIVLVKKGETPIHEVYLKTEGKTFISGHTKIPYDASSGIYHFAAYGIHQTSKDLVKLATAFVPIYNDLEKDLAINTVEASTLTKSNTIKDNTLDVRINLTEQTINKRNSINTNIQVLDKNGNPTKVTLSISVKDVTIVENTFTGGQAIWSVKIDEATRKAELDTDIYINGTVIRAGKVAKRLPIIGLYSEADNQFYYTGTDDNGRFSIRLPDFSQQKSVQFVNYEAESIQVQLDKAFQLGQSPELVVNEEILDYLALSRKRKKLAQLFKIQETIIAPAKEAVTKKIAVPDDSFILKNYEPFEDIFALFKEVSTPLKIKKEKDGSMSAKMFNPSTETRNRDFYSGNPIFIIDGKVTSDVAFVNQLDMNLVEQVDLFFNKENLKQQFGAIGSSGVVMIKTNLPTIQLPDVEQKNIFTINGILPQGVYPMMDTATADISSSTPIFKSTIYWSADQQTNLQGNATFSFFQTDDLGTFEIEIIALDEAGNIGFATKKYFVKEQ